MSPRRQVYNLLGEELPGINVKSASEESTALVTVWSLGLWLENYFCPVLTSKQAKFSESCS